MEKKYSLRFVLILAASASALTCLILLFTAGRELGVFNGRFGNVRTYAALLSEIDSLYVGDYEKSDVSDAAMYAAVDILGDRWSYYMTAEEYTEYLDDTNNRYTGIGIGVAIDEETGGMDVLYVYPGSAAAEAGLLDTDIILEIDGEDITGKTIDEMSALLDRNIGESVELTVLRGDGSCGTLAAVYGFVFVDPVYFELLDGGIGYIMIGNFDYGTADSFIAATESLCEQGAVSLVFDVRNNGGGRVDELTRILDYLLPEGEIFISVKRDGTDEITYSDESHIDMPSAVLINAYSYSAAEYFAALLGEYEYSYIVGEQTTGKNRSQVTVEIPGGGALHISSAEYLTKNRVSLFETGGLEPDYPVSLTEEQFMLFVSGGLDTADDPQLQKAMELVS